MSTEILTVKCSECSAKLKLKNRNALGKKVPCPKCGQTILLKLSDGGGDSSTSAAIPSEPSGGPTKKTTSPAAVVDQFDEFDDIENATTPLRALPSRNSEEAPKKNSAKKKKVSSSKKIHVDREPGGIGMCIILGLVAGLIGAAIWGGIGYATGYEIGWLAWGIGAACGAAVGAASGEIDETISGMIAVGCALGSIVLGKYLIVYFVVKDMVGAEFARHINMLDALRATLHPMDALWVILAAGTAYRLGSGNADD